MRWNEYKECPWVLSNSIGELILLPMKAMYDHLAQLFCLWGSSQCLGLLMVWIQKSCLITFLYPNFLDEAYRLGNHWYISFRLNQLCTKLDTSFQSLSKSSCVSPPPKEENESFVRDPIDFSDSEAESFEAGFISPLRPALDIIDW